MKFKAPHMEDQFHKAPMKLREVAAYFVWLSYGMKITPVVTRLFDEVPGESGVHPAKRAIDFRDDFASGSLYTDEQVRTLVQLVNARYPRKDGKDVCLHHSFKGGPKHFHLQIPAGWLTEEERMNS